MSNVELKQSELMNLSNTKKTTTTTTKSVFRCNASRKMNGTNDIRNGQGKKRTNKKRKKNVIDFDANTFERRGPEKNMNETNGIESKWHQFNISLYAAAFSLSRFPLISDTFDGSRSRHILPKGNASRLFNFVHRLSFDTEKNYIMFSEREEPKWRWWRWRQWRRMRMNRFNT